MKRFITYILILCIVMTTTIASYANDDIQNQKEVPEIEIISPSDDIIYSNYLLISVKIRNEKTFQVTLYANDTNEGVDDIRVQPIISTGAITVTDSTEENDLLNKEIFYGPVEVKTTGAFSFYTIELENLLPGKYQILIEEVSEDASKISILRGFEIKKTSERPKELAQPNIFTDRPSNRVEVLESFIKSIFGN